MGAANTPHDVLDTTQRHGDEHAARPTSRLGRSRASGKPSITSKKPLMVKHLHHSA
jgi:hypothetical protein